MMQVGKVVTAEGQVTFGRDEAMFEGLLAFVAQLSVALWALVILTLVVRFVGILLYRRGASRTAPGGAVAPLGTAPATATAGTFGETAQPVGASAAVDASLEVPHRAPAFATGPTEA